MPNMHHSFDSRLEHRALGSAALTAATVLATVNEPAARRVAYRTLLNLEAVKVSAGNEVYTVVVELSNDGFSTVGATAAIASFGDSTARQSGVADSAAGDIHEMLWSTEVNDVKYADWRIKLFVGGTAPSLTVGAYSTVLGNV